LVYVDDVNLLHDDVCTIKKNLETLINANKEVDIELTKYMLLSRHQSAAQK
jgi:hypothetical protein